MMTTFMDFQGPSFRMQVPTEWFVSSTSHLQAIFIAPVAAEIRPNVTLAMRRVEENVNAQSVAEATEAAQQAEYAGYEVIEEGEIAGQNIEGFYRQYKWHDKDKRVNIVQQQSFFVAGQVLYTFTATRQDTEDAAKLDKVTRQMFQSFRIKTGSIPGYTEYSESII